MVVCASYTSWKSARTITASFTDELPVTYDVYIYCMFHSTLTLKKNLHSKVAMHTEAGWVSTRVHDTVMHWLTKCHPFVASSVCDPHKVQNICIALIGIHQKTSTFFPSLDTRYQGMSHADLDEGYLADVNDYGLYPAICCLAPELTTNWSPYTAVELCAQNLNGMCQMGTPVS